MSYEKNIFQSQNSKYLGSKVSSLSLKSDEENVKVEDLEHPIEIKLENEEDKLTGEPIIFYIPGKLLTSTVSLHDEHCVLMLHIEPPDDLAEGTVLHVLAQYAKPPTEDVSWL